MENLKTVNSEWINKLRVISGKNVTEKKQFKRTNRYREAKILRNCEPLDVHILIPMR